MIKGREGWTEGRREEGEILSGTIRARRNMKQSEVK